MAVIVPAADEEERIGDCLSAIRAAAGCLYRETGILARVILALDRCLDQTAAIARRSAGVELVTASARNVGAARRAGPARRWPGRGGPVNCGWPAPTPTPRSRPAGSPGCWPRPGPGRTSCSARSSPGRPGPGPPPRLAGRHQLRDGHPHVHGANLGIRGDAYLALGGCAALPTGEGTELARRATAAGHVRIARSAAIPVVTSTRRAGRAPQGFSGYLRDLSPGGLAGAPACGQ